MARIIKLKQGDTVPAGAKFIHAKEEKEVVDVSYRTEPDFLADNFPFLWSNPISRVTSFKRVTYFFYEVES